MAFSSGLLPSEQQLITYLAAMNSSRVTSLMSGMLASIFFLLISMAFRPRREIFAAGGFALRLAGCTSTPGRGWIEEFSIVTEFRKALSNDNGDFKHDQNLMRVV